MNFKKMKFVIMQKYISIVSAIGQRVWVETSTWPYNWENLVRQRGRETSFQTYAREGLFVGGQMDSRCLS